MNSPNDQMEFSIKLPYLTAKYTSLFTLTYISAEIVRRSMNFGEWKSIYSISIILIMMITAAFMLKSMLKKRKLVIEEDRLIVDEVPISASNMTSASIHTLYIELVTSNKKWSERYIRFDFKGDDRERSRNQLLMWLRRHAIVIK